jgi:ribosome-binding protein aMBF1 (putative translation factor)
MKCKGCGEEVDELFPVKVKGRTKKLCEECVELAEEEGAIEEGAFAAMKDMMGYKG